MSASCTMSMGLTDVAHAHARGLNSSHRAAANTYSNCVDKCTVLMTMKQEERGPTPPLLPHEKQHAIRLQRRRLPGNYDEVGLVPWLVHSGHHDVQGCCSTS